MFILQYSSLEIDLIEEHQPEDHSLLKRVNLTAFPCDCDDIKNFTEIKIIIPETKKVIILFIETNYSFNFK